MHHKPGSPNSIDQEIHHLVADDRLHEAIERLEEEAAGGFSGLLQSDVTLLRRRLKAIDEENRRGTVSKDKLAASLQGVAEAILKTLGEVSPPTSVRMPLRSLEPAEIKARSQYLKHTRQHVENLLHESIHNARFIDLGATDTPIATNLPWVYKNTDTAQEFGSIAAAFQAYDRRLLILGTPGAGKTVTLLHLALELITEAEGNLAAPIPLIVNLSKFQFEPSSPPILERLLPRRWQQPSSNRSFEAWLVAEFAERPGVPRSDARRWVEEGRIAALLDGLDEVNDERRAEMAVLLNSSFLRDHPDSTVVVCSRSDEYRPLQDRKATRLQLPGAITLQPLSPSQIAAYLNEAHASGLRQALGRDATLEELAQTPLTLSMMTLAYGGLSAEAIPAFRLVADQRHHLMESFVSRMLQRKERRDRDIPFDDDKDKDVEPSDFRYQPAQVNRYLNWLAVRLSVRMQTACSLGKFYSFLARGLDGPPQTLDAWVTMLAKAGLLTLCLPVAVLGFVPSFGSFIFAALAIVISCCGTKHFASTVKSRLDRTTWDNELVWMAILALPVAVGFAALSRSIAVVVPLGLAPMSAGLIALTSCIAGLTLIVVVCDRSDKKPLLVAAGTVAGLALGVASTHLRWNSWPEDRILAIAMVAGQVVGILTWFAREESARSALWPGSVIALAVVAGILGLQAGALWLVGSLHWAVAYALIGTTLILILTYAEKPAGPLGGVALSSAIGSLLSGKEGALLGCSVFGCLTLAWLLATEGSKEKQGKLQKELARISRNMLEAAQVWAEHWILSPATLVIASGFRLLPWRLRCFLRYAGQSLLLKTFSGEIEFVHRRLRDYFALRELVPQLRGPDLHQRVGVIRALGFQGAAAVELLAELITEGSTEERTVAVNAIARISAPEVTTHLNRALADPAPEVRRAVVGNLRNISKEDRVRMLTRAAGDSESTVQMAVIDAAHEDYRADTYESKATAIIRTMLDEGRNVLEILRYISAKADDRWASAVGDHLPAPCGVALEALLLDIQFRARAAACAWMGQNQGLANVASILILLGTDADSSVRRTAAQALAKLGDARAVEPLIRALADKESGVRRAAAQALGALKDARAVEPLIRALADKESGVRDKAAEALGALKDAGAVEPLIRALADKESEVRRAAAEPLGALKDPRAVEPLIRALADKESGVRRAAAQALAELGDARAVEPLIRALAEMKLEKMKQDARDWWGEFEWKQAWRAAVEALARLGDGRAVEPLLNSDDPEHRQIGVYLFAQGKDRLDKRLLSRDLDATGPWLDPHEPVKDAQVSNAARRLGLATDQVRSRYEAMATEMGLKLGWKS